MANNEYKLTEAIIKRSEANNWSEARQEWYFLHCYYQEEPDTCLCGHFPINNICVIKNELNGRRAEVGNICVDKFMGISDGTKIFTSLTGVKKGSRQSINDESLEYLYEHDLISDHEYSVYKSIRRKRILSDKQEWIKNKVHLIFIDYTSDIDNSVIKKIMKAQAVISNNKFLNDIKRQFLKKAKLSKKQTDSLNKIYNNIK